MPRLSSRVLYHQTKVCRQPATQGGSGLTKLLRHTATHASRIELPELYKLGILLKDPNDVLGLSQNLPFMEGLARRYQDLRPQATPFQISLLDAVLQISTTTTTIDDAHLRSSASATTAAASSSSSSSSVPSTATTSPVTAQEYFQAIMEMVQEVEAEHGRAVAREGRQNAKAQPDKRNERINEKKDSAGKSSSKRGERSTSSSALADQASSAELTHVPSLGETLGATRAASLEHHLNALEPLLRQLSPQDTIRLIKTLAKLNYTNYEHTVLLTRRGCEVASHVKRHDLCVLFFNLHKLHTRDSLTPVANRILEHVVELTAEEVYMLCQSFERQENTSTASQRLIAALIPQAVRKLPDAASSAYHRSLLVSMARYHVQQPATVQLVLQDWVARWRNTSSEKDVLVLLEAATELSTTEPAVLKELIDRLTFLAPSIDLWHVDRVMDALSAVPMDMSADCMRILLTRLENEAGRLSVGQLKFVLDLLSTYPPAKGQVAIVSLAYASAVRAKSMDAETLESILISLAMLHLFTDDFFSLALVLQTQKGGIRSFEKARTLLDCCTAEMVAQPHGLNMLSSVICTLAPVLNDEELSYCRKALVRLGVKDREVLQKIFTQAKRTQRGVLSSTSSSSRKRRGGYRDPMADLL